MFVLVGVSQRTIKRCVHFAVYWWNFINRSENYTRRARDKNANLERERGRKRKEKWGGKNKRLKKKPRKFDEKKQ